MNLVIVQAEHYEGDGWWSWAVWLEGPDLDQIEAVEWTLHPTFPKPVRRCTDRATKFRIESAGWGGFRITARLESKVAMKAITHELVLHYPDGSATQA